MLEKKDVTLEHIEDIEDQLEALDLLLEANVETEMGTVVRTVDSSRDSSSSVDEVESETSVTTSSSFLQTTKRFAKYESHNSAKAHKKHK